MKKVRLLLLLSAGALCAAPAVEPPTTDISNGIISAKLFLPDPDNGYYRGSRFDWSGVITQLDWKGHTYFGQWFKDYSPTLHDAIQGPVEAFDPIGYDQAKIGEGYVKIGIGVVTRIDDDPVAFSKYYPVLRTGTWDIKTKPDQIQFVQTLNDPICSYRYEKKIALTKGKAEMVIEHTLKNTGTKVIETSVYNHNFFMLDKQLTGPGFEVTLPFDYTGSVTGGLENLVQIKGRSLTYLKELDVKDRTLFRDMAEGKPVDYSIKIENHKTGAGVAITGDKPIAKFQYWSCWTTVCPEPFIKISIEPGGEFSWKNTYAFFESK